MGVPAQVEEIVTLTPFAVLFRYADFDLDEEPISLPDMIVLVEHVHGWASGFVSLTPKPD